jgi:hypothetical protein
MLVTRAKQIRATLSCVERFLDDLRSVQNAFPSSKGPEFGMRTSVDPFALRITSYVRAVVSSRRHFDRTR